MLKEKQKRCSVVERQPGACIIHLNSLETKDNPSATTPNFLITPYTKSNAPNFHRTNTQFVFCFFLQWRFLSQDQLCSIYLLDSTSDSLYLDQNSLQKKKQRWFTIFYNLKNTSKVFGLPSSRHLRAANQQRPQVARESSRFNKAALLSLHISPTSPREFHYSLRPLGNFALYMRYKLTRTRGRTCRCKKIRVTRMFLLARKRRRCCIIYLSCTWLSKSLFDIVNNPWSAKTIVFPLITFLEGKSNLATIYCRSGIFVFTIHQIKNYYS